MGFFEKMGFGSKKEEPVVKTEVLSPEAEALKNVQEGVKAELENQDGAKVENGTESRKEKFKAKAQEILDAFKEYKGKLSDAEKQESNFKIVYAYVKKIVDAASNGQVISDLNLELQGIYSKAGNKFPKVDAGEFVNEDARYTGGVTSGSSAMQAK